MVRTMVDGETWEPFRHFEEYDRDLPQQELLRRVLANVEKRTEFMLDRYRRPFDAITPQSLPKVSCHANFTNTPSPTDISFKKA